jgi:hypothetical protein
MKIQITKVESLKLTAMPVHSCDGNPYCTS